MISVPERNKTSNDVSLHYTPFDRKDTSSGVVITFCNFTIEFLVLYGYPGCLPPIASSHCMCLRTLFDFPLLEHRLDPPPNFFVKFKTYYIK